MILENVAQNPEAHPRFSKQAVSHCNGGLRHEHPEGPARARLATGGRREDSAVELATDKG